MTSILTGDIIKSRGTQSQDVWLEPLKKAMNQVAKMPNLFEIYRGDSFQLEIEDYSESFETAVYLKSCIKSIKGFDVRMSIGIGEKTYTGKTVGESNGEAFIYSGEMFETLKKDKQNLKIKTNSNAFNKEMNLFFKLALIAMDNWTPNSAEIVKLTLENPNKIQEELAKLIGISQDAVSKRQKRAYIDEILELNQLYQQKIKTLL
ncbi:transcriptional regulator [Paucihalobacter sp.]|uniref:transcriptional regulator n=1 Tax=Paucihalobacter sp. TaxID=2850405 RepID=UPI002FE08FA9